jgi:hypothetical protein
MGSCHSVRESFRSERSIASITRGNFSIFGQNIELEGNKSLPSEHKLNFWIEERERSGEKEVGDDLLVFTIVLDRFDHPIRALDHC